MFLKVAYEHELRAGLRPFFAFPFLHTFYFLLLVQANYQATLQYIQLYFLNELHSNKKVI